MVVQEKCLVDSISRGEHVQRELMHFLKSCMNLCFLRWLKPNLNLVSNFRTKGWWILYIKSEVGRPSLSTVFLNFLKDFSLIAFIICILLFTYLVIWLNYPCNFHNILSIVDSSSLLFENASDDRMKRKLILFKINMILSKKNS